MLDSLEIVIVNSPLFRESSDKYDEDSLPPLGLGYIATELKIRGFKVRLIDAVDQRIPLVDLLKSLNKNKPRFVATNIFTTNYELVKELIEGLDFQSHIIVGGLATKDLYEKIFSWNTMNNIDVVVGDGEFIVPAIVGRNVEQQPVASQPYRRAFQVDKNSPYVVEDISQVSLDRSFFKNEPIRHPFGFSEANIVASRGCIYNCAFCAAARSLNLDYPVRERSVQSIKNELREIAADYPEVSSIRVLDDLFLKNSKSVNTAIQVFQGEGFQWRSMAHVMTFDKLDAEPLARLKDSGCKELFIGVESGSPKVLKSIRKTPDRNRITTNILKVFKAGIDVKGYFIYGFPEETEADMKLTLDLAKELVKQAEANGVSFRTSVFQYRPYHGTEIHRSLANQGKELDVKRVQQNDELSELVGRLQFNFHSGNYSKVSDQRLHDYIYRTTLLNDPELFSGKAFKTESKRA